ETASATDLPLSDASVDVCVMLELLEHVRDWKSCIDECTRVLRPGGALYLSTSNRLCPKQQEYNLPLYSWYPAVLKRRYETLAVTTRPQIANFATYPAVHWFSFYSLKAALQQRGFVGFYDRFDLISLEDRGVLLNALITAIQKCTPLRFL